MIARRDRPTSREISCVRPPIRPFRDSRSLRVFVDAGSMAYSAVTQPSPEPFRQRGTPSLALAAHSTRVFPNSASTDPAAWSSQLRLIVTGRSWSLVRPSARVMERPYPRSEGVRRPGDRDLERAVVRLARLGQRPRGVVQWRDVGEPQPTGTGLGGSGTGLLAGE